MKVSRYYLSTCTLCETSQHAAGVNGTFDIEICWGDSIATLAGILRLVLRLRVQDPQDTTVFSPLDLILAWSVLQPQTDRRITQAWQAKHINKNNNIRQWQDLLDSLVSRTDNVVGTDICVEMSLNVHMPVIVSTSVQWRLGFHLGRR